MKHLIWLGTTLFMLQTLGCALETKSNSSLLSDQPIVRYSTGGKKILATDDKIEYSPGLVGTLNCNCGSGTCYANATWTVPKEDVDSGFFICSYEPECKQKQGQCTPNINLGRISITTQLKAWEDFHDLTCHGGGHAYIHLNRIVLRKYLDDTCMPVSSTPPIDGPSIEQKVGCSPQGIPICQMFKGSAPVGQEVVPVV